MNLDEWPPIEEEIQRLWEKWSHSGKIKYIELGNLDEFIESVVEENNQFVLEKLDNNIRLFDELLGWMLNLSMAVKECPSEADGTLSAANRSYIMLVGAICSHLISIRHLVNLGHDLPAKQVLRSLTEHLNMLNLLWLNPNLCGEFVCVETPEAANKFWHTHVSKGKLKKHTRKMLFKAAKEQNEIEAIDEWRKFREEEEKVLGMAVHPNYLSAAFSTVPAGLSKESEMPGYLGMKSETSIRTLKYAISASWELLLNGTFPFGSISKGTFSGRRIIAYNSENKYHTSVLLGRQVLHDIIFLLAKWEDKNPHLEGEFGVWPHSE